ncbi:Transposase and inactivated derivatives [Raoultella ornithinolytica]|nr:Transposase and inactivated derivatives [Raoultella ornithinolytica]
MKNMTLALGLLISSFAASAADMSKGADNFYKSDKVIQQKVTFKNQYQMSVVGNLFIPKTLDQNVKKSGNYCRTSDGGGKRAKLESVCAKTGGSGLCDAGNRSLLLG